MQAVILAGGRGRRLLPYTTVLPKPLMPIGDIPIIEVIIRQLVNHGFDDIIISTGYLHELIIAYINQKRDINSFIRFSHEEKPLGTIGPLKLIENLEDNFLVMNGDILTDLKYSELFNYHNQKGALLTVSTYIRVVDIDFGVLRSDEQGRIVQFQEKPKLEYEVSMGIYVLNKQLLEKVPQNMAYGFDHLMYDLIKRKDPVFRFPWKGYWLDIGRPDDYQKAIEEFETSKQRLCP